MRKRLFILLSILLATIATCDISAQKRNSSSSLAFDEYEWNFGNINEVDGPVSHTFKFKNTSKAPVIFERVITTCGCTTPTYPRQPIYADQEGAITITYDPADRPGRFSKTITIITGNGKNRDVITIKGVVNARPKTVEDSYPFLLGKELRADNAHLSFGYVKQGATKSMVIEVINISSQPVQLDMKWLAESGFMNISYPKTINANKKATITFTYDLSKNNNYGIMSDQIRFIINGKDAILPINTDATGVDDLSQINRRKAPMMQLSAGFVNFGKCKKGSPIEKTLTITNNGVSPLIIRNVQCRSNTETTLKTGTELNKGESKEFIVRLVPEVDEYGSVFGSMVIISNDPDRPMREIRINANIE